MLLISTFRFFFRFSLKDVESTTRLLRWSDAPPDARRCFTWGSNPVWSWNLSPDCRLFTIQTTVTSCPCLFHCNSRIALSFFREKHCTKWVFFLKRQLNVFKWHVFSMILCLWTNSVFSIWNDSKWCSLIHSIQTFWDDRVCVSVGPLLWTRLKYLNNC